MNEIRRKQTIGVAGVGRSFPVRRWKLLGGVAFFTPVLAGCATYGGALAPRGPRAEAIGDLWWLMAVAGTAIWAGVVAILLYGLFVRRPPEESDGQARDNVGWILWGGVVLPVVVLAVLYGLTLRTMSALSSPAAAGDVAIEVIGNQFWWEVRYPNLGFETANEIHIPVGQPVELRLTSEDVIHSFWVPELMGKLDLIPGRTNSVWLEASEPGVYRGQCAEFCGVQHGKMALLVIAQPADEFAAWLELQSQPAPQVTGAAQEGEQIFQGSGCVYCHAIRGTNATGDLGPDLTHLASRRTLAAAEVPNTRGNLAGWIVDPQGIKPGNRMPPTDLSAEELHLLLAYLESLE